MVNGDHSLVSFSSVSPICREVCAPHIFRCIRYPSADRNAPSLEQYCKNLKCLKNYYDFVKSFVIAPVGNMAKSPRITTVMLCTLCAILKKFPKLETLEMRCFTWRACTQNHACIAGMPPLFLRQLQMYHFRVVGGQDPLTVLRIASSARSVTMLGVLPTGCISELDTTSIGLVAPTSLHVQLPMDRCVYRTAGNLRETVLRYDSHLALSTALRLQLASTLVHLRLDWTLSHSNRGTSRMSLRFSHIQTFLVGTNQQLCLAILSRTCLLISLAAWR